MGCFVCQLLMPFALKSYQAEPRYCQFCCWAECSSPAAAGVPAACPALLWIRNNHLGIKAGLGCRLVTQSQLCPGLPLWPGGDCMEEQPAGVVATKPISVQANCWTKAFREQSVDGPGLLVQAGHLAELERCWKQGEAQLALGRFRVPFAKRGLLLHFSPFLLINKQVPQPVS